jgi:aminoglycoside phosphotransferase (APT) family kinase protein
MHSNEVPTDASLVRRLLAAQFPRWAHLSIAPVDSAGTDNAIYRLGDDMALRLPRIHWAVGNVEKEHQWLPRLAPHLPLTIPGPLAKGHPGEGYPWHWSIYRWLAGENATVASFIDANQTAIDLAQFILALQRIDIADGPLAEHYNLRGVPLVTRDRSTREAIAALRGTIDVDAVTAAWEVAMRASEWHRAPVWFHGDLLPGNLLFERGRSSAVIDFGCMGVGDPACDLMIAWGLFSGESRDAFRATLAVDDATWARGRGQALSQALSFTSYYLNTNPVGVSVARRTIEAIVDDHRASDS